tara:strand:- start:342 stop:551 length:210 start_codon:yes stop_codon:yes gene_type:complete
MYVTLLPLNKIRVNITLCENQYHITTGNYNVAVGHNAGDIFTPNVDNWDKNAYYFLENLCEILTTGLVI